MGLINAAGVMGYVENFRICWIKGRYGGGKTSLAFRLAYELVMRRGYRHILSNVKSVWADNFEDVTLRDGRYLDAVVVLDEGGIFLKTTKEADQFLAYLRKLNVCLLVPSVMPPSARISSMLTVQRTMNLNVFGLPAWWYGVDLNYGRVHEKDWFAWWRPAEIFGIYDTLGAPEDDAGISEWLAGATAKVFERQGYSQKKLAAAAKTGSHQVTVWGGSSVGGGGGSQAASVGQVSQAADAEGSQVAALRGVAAEIAEASESMAAVVSILGQAGSNKRRRR